MNMQNQHWDQIIEASRNMYSMQMFVRKYINVSFSSLEKQTYPDVINHPIKRSEVEVSSPKKCEMQTPFLLQREERKNLFSTDQTKDENSAASESAAAAAATAAATIAAAAAGRIDRV